METYEIAILSKVGLDRLITIISIYTDVSSTQIMAETDYFDAMSLNTTAIGIRIDYQTQGFQTWVRLYCTNYEFDDLSLVKLSLAIVRELNTDVAIADPAWKGDPEIPAQIIISPDQTYRKAYLDDDEDFNILKSHSYTGEFERNEISQIIQYLEKLAS